MDKCYHCHDNLPSHLSITAIIDGEKRPVCCYGCKAVAETIDGAGLNQYYQYRTSPASKVEPGEQEDYQLYDQAAFNHEFVNRRADGYQCADLLIEGVSCAACSWLIEKSIALQPGVQNIHFNLQDKRLRLTWDDQQSTLSQFIQRISNLGYKPKPYLPDALKESHRQEHYVFLKRLGVAFIGMMQVGMFAIGLHAGDAGDISPEHRDLLRWVSALVTTPVVFYSAGVFFSNAWRGLKAKSASMDLPVSIAIGIAYGLSLMATVLGNGEVYYDSIIMFTFLLLLGRYVEMRARHQLGDPATALRAILPRSASRLKLSNKQWIPVVTALNDIQVGDRLLIKPGEVIPVDGLVVEGLSSVDESTFTGESIPQNKTIGDPLLGGTINIESPLHVEVSHDLNNSRLHAVYDMLVNAQAHKPKIAAMVDALAVKFISTVLLLSSITAAYWYYVAPQDAVWIGLSVLVVSCPCALSLATPTALTAAITRLKAIGLLVVSGDVIDKFRHVDTVVFDKTGTLTTGHIQLAACCNVADLDQATCLAIASAMERDSEHPIARAFHHSTEQHMALQQRRNIPGSGVEAWLDGHRYRLGKPDFSCEKSVSPPYPSQWICLSRDGELVAWFELSDSLRREAAETIQMLQRHGMRVDILSGDSQFAVANVAQELGIEHWQAGVSPEQKLSYLTSLQSQGRRVLMVGDGINDVGVLAGADLSVAMGMASELVKTNADLILLNPDLRALQQGMNVASRCDVVIKQNIAWSLLYNASAIPLAMMGWVQPYQAAIGMSLSSLVVVINALRFKGKQQ